MTEIELKLTHMEKYQKQVKSLAKRLIVEINKRIANLKGDEISFNENLISYERIDSEMLGTPFLLERIITGVNSKGEFVATRDGDPVTLAPMDIRDVMELAEILDALYNMEYEYVNPAQK